MHRQAKEDLNRIGEILCELETRLKNTIRYAHTHEELDYIASSLDYTQDILTNIDRLKEWANICENKNCNFCTIQSECKQLIDSSKK